MGAVKAVPIMFWRGIMNDLKIRPVEIKTVAPYPVEVRLDRVRHLIMDLNAYEELENIYENEPPIFITDTDGAKKEIASLIGKAFEYLSTDRKKIKHIKNFLYAGLLHEDSTLTPAKVGTLISGINITEITDQIWQAVAQATPDAKEGSEASSGE